MSFGRFLAIVLLLVVAFFLLAGWQEAQIAQRVTPPPARQKTVYRPQIKAKEGSHDYYVALARYDASYVGIDPNKYVHQITVESNFNPLAASGSGDIGIAQFQPTTAAALPDPFTGKIPLNAWNPEQSLLAAALLMATYVQRYSGSYEAALAAYNCGQTCTDQAIAQGVNWQAYLPSSTRAYIRKILQEGSIGVRKDGNTNELTRICEACRA
jgi:soluble lytic murein transglycosylase-like protein